MQNGFIDAHVHLTPAHLLGTRNERIGVEFLPYGRIVLRTGEVVQSMPEVIADSAFPAESMLRVMDLNGVDKVLVLANSITDLQENIRAVQTYPDRFAAAMTIEQNADALDVMRAYRAAGLTVIKFEMSDGMGYTHPCMYPDFRLNSPLMNEVYAAAGELGITITVDPSRIGGYAYQVEELRQMTERYTETHFVFCHLGFPDVPMEKGSPHWARWREMTALAARDNVWFDIAALSDFYRSEGYPYPTAAEMVRAFMNEYGADKVVWGSDAPGSMCASTYRQMIQMYDASPLFTEQEKRLLFRDNAIAAYRL